jgi:nitrate/nitrite transporter NarK
VSFACAIVLAIIDRYADKKDNKTVVLTEADKFQLKDLKEFSLSFWLIVLSCVFVYMSIFPYIQNAEGLMEQKFGFSAETAGTWYGTPYFMSAFLSPVLGYGIDKVGKRALVTEENWIIMVPLCMLGVGYSVYASALWGSIPYVVKPANLGTAFGITTAV